MIKTRRPIIFRMKKLRILLSALFIALLFSVPVKAKNKENSPPSGGLNMPVEPKNVRKAYLKGDRLVVPSNAPKRIKRVIRAANRISDRPYVFGGGHGSFRSRGYDCSGAVSYALHGGNFLQSPLASGALMSWGRKGKGEWLTVLSNSGHAFMLVAGFRFDTSGTGGKGPRWHKSLNKSIWSDFRLRTVKGF